jgi:hypothetical protein
MKLSFRDWLLIGFAIGFVGGFLGYLGTVGL